LALLLLAAGCGHQHIVERPLPVEDGLACSGFLVWDREPVRDVFLVLNGSGPSSNAFVHPSFDGLLRSRAIAYATYDKPGVHAPFGDPRAVHHDDAALARYTLANGTACAVSAVRWARDRFGAAVRIHLRGHSEGSLIALYTYDELLARDPATASAIATVVLSGVPLEPLRQILERQIASLPDGDQLRRAFVDCDFGVLKKRMGVSCAYVEDAARRPSGRAMFERLAGRAAAARFYIFHGNSDWNTPVQPVRALETWNTTEGHLNLQFHFYDGGHGGSAAAKAEVTALLRSLVQ
jgi:hypothetical protein